MNMMDMASAFMEHNTNMNIILDTLLPYFLSEKFV